MLKLLIPTLTLIGFVQLGHMADAHTGKGYTLGERKVKDYVLDKAESEARATPHIMPAKGKRINREVTHSIDCSQGAPAYNTHGKEFRDGDTPLCAEVSFKAQTDQQLAEVLKGEF